MADALPHPHETHAPDQRSQPIENRGIPLFRVFGIRIRLDYSWFLIFALIWVSLSAGYFPQVAQEYGTAAHWIAGLLATLLFFGSILVHELAHAWVALRAKIPVPDITLFLFGGVSRMEQEPRSPGIEFRVAIVGPLTSLFLAAGFFFLAWAVPEAPLMIPTIFGYLGLINLALGVFNLLPGYPLDGGRVLRALVWWKTGSLRRGTRVASNSGKAFAVALMVLGGLQILFTPNLLGGVWFILIGLFLRTLAVRGYEDIVLRNVLADVAVSDVMIPRERLAAIAPSATLRELVDDQFLARGIRAMPVVEGDRTLGIVSADGVRAVDKERWPEVTVSEVLVPLDEKLRTRPDTPALDAMRRLAASPAQRLLVMEGDRLVGMLSARDVSRSI